MNPGASHTRVVLLGASNLTRGFAVVTELVRRTFGEPCEIVAAIGHGRSYGMASSVFGRRLPSILECGLWPALEAAPPTPTVAVVGDVGNDVLYGAPVEQILKWVSECVRRLRDRGAVVVVTSLPAPTRTGGRAHFLTFRALFFPARALEYEIMQTTVRALDEGLRDLARDQGARFVEMQPAWYGFDPIHISPLACRAAWRDILSGLAEAPACPRVGVARSLLTYRLLPEQQWLFGREMRTAQPCGRLRSGTTISLY
jgi:hypothetical protein